MPDSAAKVFASMVSGLAASGQSLRAIARETHVSPATLSRATNGDVKMPLHETFVRVERAWERAGKPVAK